MRGDCLAVALSVALAPVSMVRAGEPSPDPVGQYVHGAARATI